MAASTPCKKHRVSHLILFPGSIKPIRIKFERLQIERLIQMDVPKSICHERAFIDGLAGNLKIICEVTAQSCAIRDQAEGLADDTFDDGHLVLPCGYWNRGEAAMVWFR